MSKQNFHTTDFNKNLKNNTRFMENLERKCVNIKNPDKRIYVSMNVLSSHILVKNINSFNQIPDLLVLINIQDNRFRIVIFVKNTDKKIYCNFPVDIQKFKEDNQQYIEENSEIKKINIEYNLLYDAASDEAKKKHNKEQKQNE